MEKSMEHMKEANGSFTEHAGVEGEHGVMVFAMGRPVSAPVDLGKLDLRILVSGDAIGRWLPDVQMMCPPDAEFTCTDVVPSNFPVEPPRGTIVQVQDINHEWPPNMHGTFDLVHERLVMLGAAPQSPEPVVLCLAKLLVPRLVPFHDGCDRPGRRLWG
ncbi:hypothetical protein LTR86_003664 [Recurvomyces mirabilis]|nr:hypothetical protein LTR86_003664 [Recurvomyces mirabilis]